MKRSELKQIIREVIEESKLIQEFEVIDGEIKLNDDVYDIEAPDMDIELNQVRVGEEDGVFYFRFLIHYHEGADIVELTLRYDSNTGESRLASVSTYGSEDPEEAEANALSAWVHGNYGKRSMKQYMQEILDALKEEE
jgi:hypothetical protein